MMIHLTSPIINNQNEGFTIIESMIATSVFAIILIIVIVGITGFFQDEYQTNIRSSVNSTTQNALNDVEQTIELSSASSSPQYFAPGTDIPPNSPGILCAGNEEYVFVLYQGVVASVPYSLYKVPVSAGVCIHYANPPSAVPSTGTSMLGNNYRLIDFRLTSIGVNTGQYAINIQTAYTSGVVSGTNDDLLCTTSVSSTSPGGCGPSAQSLKPSQYNLAGITCKQGVGSQFCATSTLNSLVAQHLKSVN